MELNTIHRAISDYYRVDKNYIFQRSRNSEIVDKRNIFYYLAKRNVKKSLSEVGRYSKDFTGKTWDHSTVIHAHNQTEDLMEFNKKLRKEVEEIEKKCELYNYVDEKVSKYKDEIIEEIYKAESIEDVNNKITEFVNNNK